MPEYLNAKLEQYLEQLASGEAIPGGGSAAALSGALGAALLAMSARFTVGREKYAAYEEVAQRVLAAADETRLELQQLIEKDAEAFAGYGAAMALPRTSEQEKATRKAALQQATLESARIPLQIAGHCARLLQHAVALAENCNPNLVSDVAVAAHMCKAALDSAIINVRLNLKYLDDQTTVAELQAALDGFANAGENYTQALASANRVMGL